MGTIVPSSRKRLIGLVSKENLQIFVVVGDYTNNLEAALRNINREEIKRR